MRVEQVNRRWAWARAALLSSCFGIVLCAGTAHAEEGPVSINHASVEMLAQHLHGVGEVTARRIVAYREANGPFQRIEDLVLVQGIGESLLERNRGRLLLAADAGDEGELRSVLRTD